MTALSLTPDQGRLAQEAIIVALIGFFVIAALVSVLGAGLRQHQPVPPVRVLPPVVEDDGTQECPRCDGAGVVDLEVWDDVLLHDVTCPRCDGVGVITGWF